MIKLGLGVAILLGFAAWCQLAVTRASELRHQLVVHQSLDRDVKRATQVLQTRDPGDPEVQRALARLQVAAETADQLGLPGVGPRLQEHTLALGEALEVEGPSPKTEARTALLIAADDLVQAAWAREDGLRSEVESQWLQVELVGLLAIGVALLALLMWARTLREQIRAEDLAGQAELQRVSAERASQTKSRFIASVSHEIRTPLTAIIGHVELLEQDAMTPSQRDRLSAIRSGGDTLLRVVSDVLDISSIEEGRVELSPVEFDPEELLDHVVLLFAKAAEGKGLNMAAISGPELPRRLRGDVSRLRQVLVNLVSNAVKFTDRGAISLHASWAEGQLQVEVRDTGMGIPPDKVGRIFEAFERVDSGRARRAGGAGLGLAISRRIIEAMDGSLTVTSHPNRGSRFLVRVALPEARPAEPPHVAGELLLQGRSEAIDDLALQLTTWGIPFQREPGLPAICVGLQRLSVGRLGGDHALQGPARPLMLRRNLRSPGMDQPSVDLPMDFDETEADAITVLLVDDNEASRRVVREMLSALGCEVSEAASGPEALGLLGPFDMVLMDMDMPGMDGLETTRRLLAQEPELRIVGLSGHVTDGAADQARAAGMLDYLTKPIRMAGLRSALGRYAKPAA